MIARALHDLIGAVYLLEEHQECQRVGHHELREPHGLVRNLRKHLQIYSIAPADDEDEVLALVFRGLKHIGEFGRFHRFTSLIEEYSTSLHLLQRLHDRDSFLDLDILGIGVGDGADWFQSDHFLCSLAIFGNGFAEVFEPVSDSKDGNH